jgi:DNA-binding NtrC family response regulator
VAAGRFREDLLYRVNTVEIHLPPLRDRRPDILPFAKRFAEQLCARHGKRPPAFSDRAVRALLEHAWPGNVRELEHVIERALLLARGESVEPEDLALDPRRGDGAAHFEQMTLEEVERHLIQRALSRSNGQVSDAAKALGLSRSAFYRRLQHFGLKGNE